MVQEIKDTKPYQTKDLLENIVLSAHGFHPVSTYTDTYGKSGKAVWFQYEGSKEFFDLLNKLDRREVRMLPQDYSNAEREVKNIIYRDR